VAFFESVSTRRPMNGHPSDLSVEDRRARHDESASVSDPMEGLSVDELAAAMGIDTAEVLRRERDGKLFSVVRPALKRGREYPAFQAWPEIAHASLLRVFDALAGLDAADHYVFFAGSTDLLCGLCPVEVLMGRLVSPRQIEPEGLLLLIDGDSRRLQAILDAAEAFVNLRAA